ncbi:MAG: hypothetical protein CMH08_10040 [Marinovum sp.]|nr:hypothetical protein [Marinovum sp.]
MLRVALIASASARSLFAWLSRVLLCSEPVKCLRQAECLNRKCNRSQGACRKVIFAPVRRLDQSALGPM